VLFLLSSLAFAGQHVMMMFSATAIKVLSQKVDVHHVIQQQAA
jgi:hypothetical protein